MKVSQNVYDLAGIVQQFHIPGSAASVLPLEKGHINDTYHIRNAEAGRPDHLLQRINHRVFRDVDVLWTTSCGSARI